MPRVGLPLIQALVTLVVIGFLPGNVAKAAVLIGWWAITFGRLRSYEIALALSACLLFSVMNVMALKRGIFYFTKPDWLGLPAYEFLMWGFYVLHVVRALGGRIPENGWGIPLALALVFAATFAAIGDPRSLLLASGAVVLLTLIFYHQPGDLAYCGYMVALGAAIEYTGVHTGNWGYPDQVWGGVPLWFITLWGGVGLFLRRLALPIFAPGARLPGLLDSAQRSPGQ